MSLALRLGRTLEELGETMSSAEFGMWLELYKIAPWDDVRGDLQAGIVAATIVNAAGMRRKPGSAPSMPLDFMPLTKDAPESKEEDPLEHFARLRDARPIH